MFNSSQLGSMQANRSMPLFSVSKKLGVLLGAAAVLCACQPKAEQANKASTATSDSGVSSQVIEHQKKVAEALANIQNTDFTDAKKGFIAAPTGQIKNAEGKVLWDFSDYAFIKGKAPDTVNPSLWRQAKLNNDVGLFKVTDHVYQLRGFDLANMTLIEGKTGWIVVDTLTCKETAKFALDFARKHLGNKPVTAVIFTHSHIDHFGGVLGVVNPKTQPNVPIVAPAGFLEEATSENIMAGPAMGRRAMYMYGRNLPKNDNGLVDNGIGKAVAYGQVGILPPTIVVSKPEQDLTLDGVRFQFFNAPNSEAPSEFTFYLPDLKVYESTELATHTLHNLYTLRGAKVRDALLWAGYLDRARAEAKDAEVLIAQHTWPVWGQKNIQDYLSNQRDVYKFIHDQTVRMMNAGMGPDAIADAIHLPPALEKFMAAHGYYGTIKHNSRAVYQYYLGWFDGNPSRLDPLPRVEADKRYIALAGGPDKALQIAQKAYNAGEFRWAAEWLNHLVFAEPSDKDARALLAKTYDQLGYMAESGPWRNEYLSAALELRNGNPEHGLDKRVMKDVLVYTPIEKFLQTMSAALIADKAEGHDMVVNFNFSDLGKNYRIDVHNSVMHFEQAPLDPKANATMTMTRPFFLDMMLGSVGAKEFVFSDQLKVSGSRLDLLRFLGMFQKSEGAFPLAAPAN